MRKTVLLISAGVRYSANDMLTEDKRAKVQAFMGETKKTDEYMRPLAVLELQAGISLEMLGITEKYAQRLTRNFYKIGVSAFIDKRHNNKPVLLTKSQCAEVLSILYTSTSKDWGYTSTPFWSSRILGSVIEETYGVVYSSRAS